MSEGGVLFEWSAEYETGVRLIDGDHHDLFDAVNQLHAAVQSDQGATDTVRGEILGFLGRYVREHFEREERLLVEYAYPKLSEHQREHTRFLKFVQAARLLNANQPLVIDPRKLVSYLGLWLRHHILHSDQDYVPYLTGRYGRRKTDGATIVEIHPRETELLGEAEGKADGAGGAGNAAGDDLVGVTLIVPARRVETLRKCANALRDEDELAERIDELVNPASEMTVEMAMEIAAPILRDP